MLIFYSSPTDLSKNNYDLSVYVHRGVDRKQELFDLFASQLKFPSYFGNNWDALFDFLSDLNWLNARSVLIIHEDLPFNKVSKEKVAYINLISDLNGKTHSDQSARIDFAFPKIYKTEIKNIIDDAQE